MLTDLEAALQGLQPESFEFKGEADAILPAKVNRSSSEHQTVFGWGQYRHRVRELPANQQAVLKGIGDTIIASYLPGHRPVGAVQVSGHADQDTPPNPAREKQMSSARAQQVTEWLRAYVGNSIANRVKWNTRGFGATKRKASSDTEAKRMQNRRVEITLSTASPLKPYVLVRHNRLVGNVAVPARPMSGQSTTAAFRALGRPGIFQVRTAIANVREDVLNTMDRLHLLWSISNRDYDAEYPTVSRLPAASIVDVRQIPRTIAAIMHNQEPTLHHQVAKYFLNHPLSQSVGRDQPNIKADVFMVQDSLRALGLLSDSDYSAERAAVSRFTAVGSPDVVMPRTLAALTALKDAIAGFRLGWRPLQADESEAGGDRYGGRTFDFTVTTRCFIPSQGRENNMPHRVSIFIPRRVTPDINRVHVFFSPRGAAEDRGDNDVLVQGLRGAADSTNWIVIGVSGVVNGWRTIDDAAIAACLTRAGRLPNVTAVRLSGHSRGVSGLTTTLNRSLISARIDRIVVLDAPELFRVAGGPSVVVYRVNVKSKTVPGAIQHDLDPACVRAIGYTRLIKNAMVTQPLLSIPATIRSQLLPIPDRGCFSTAPARTFSGCQVSFGDFCRRNKALINTIIRQERGPNGLHNFVESNNLLRAGHPVSPAIYSHHIFVAEIAHEITTS
jgi:hypothetical protein